MTNLRRLACLIAAAAAVALAHAQAPAPAAPAGAPQAPPVPEYKVEIILFAYRDFDLGEERFDHRLPQLALTANPLERRPPPVFDESTLESLSPDDTASLSVEPGAAAPFRFRLLQPEELTLTRHYQALSRIDAYEPIVHGGWVQQALPENEAREFDVSLLGVLNPRGTLRLYLGRYLHLNVNLVYQDQRGAVPQPVFGDSALAELPLAPSYTLRTERQVPRSGELHYFDHPAFGLLVVVSPLPAGAEPVVPRVQPAA